MNNFLTLALLFIIGPLAIGQLPTSVIPEPYCSGFNQPTEIAHAQDKRLFVCEKEGAIRVIDESGILVEKSFLDITSLVDPFGERGLLGLAFHPRYDDNGYFYIFYTDLNRDNNVVRYTVSSDDPNVADMSSAKQIYSMDETQAYHQGGCLKFGPDGLLYIAAGDLGWGNEVQDLSQENGSILRIDIDQGDPYAIPDDNPFVNDSEALDEIIVNGLRNPWKISFDRVSGDLWIADVGQDIYEEINRIDASELNAGLNLGWPCYEGPIRVDDWGCPDSTLVFTGPVGGYPYKDKPYNPLNQFNQTCGGSITGGYVYRGAHAELAALGAYISSDYCTGQINATYLENGSYKTVEIFRNREMLDDVSTLGEDIDGELYVADVEKGIVYHLDFNCKLPEFVTTVATCPESKDGCIEITIPDDAGILNVILQDSTGAVIPEEAYCALGSGRYTMIVNNASSDCTKNILFLVAYLEPTISTSIASCSSALDGTVDISFDQNLPEQFNYYLEIDNEIVDTSDYNKLAAGDYAVVVENIESSCSYRHEFSISYNSDIVPITREGDSLFVEQDTFVSYQWRNYEIEGFMLISIDTIVGAVLPYFIAEESGYYRVFAVANDGCIDRSNGIDVVLTATDDVEVYPKFHLYPNPTSEVVTIELEDVGYQELSAKIYNLMGHKVLDKKLGVHSLKHNLEVKNLAQGCYLLEISDGERVQIEKFFKN